MNDEKFCDVPHGWSFSPNYDLLNVYMLWCIGPNYSYTSLSGIVRNAPVRPFALFCPEMLPSKLRIMFQTNWKPVFNKMIVKSDIIVPKRFKEEYLNETYSEGADHLK